LKADELGSDSQLTEAKLQLSPLSYRPDIDGLRAISVSSVVIFHAFPNWMPGGFTGVDVFFVISGFLISRIILEGLNKGTFSFAEFYGRRIRRIFPALILVLVASYVFGWFTLLALEYAQLGKHIAAGAGFVANLALWSETDYFDNSADTKPLLHLWSLGIEEQFYLIWPLFLWFAWKCKSMLPVVIGTVALISFGLNIITSKTDLVAAFYSPQTRFWELLLGSLVAWFSLSGRRVKGEISTRILSLLGLALIVIGFWVVDRDQSFPGWWALLPVMGAVLILLAGPDAWVNQKILSLKPLVWVGLISYPLYLWHWPLLSFFRILWSQSTSPFPIVGLVALSIALSWITYRYVESNVRGGGHAKVKISILVIVMTVVGVIGYETHRRDGVDGVRFAGHYLPAFFSGNNSSIALPRASPTRK